MSPYKLDRQYAKEIHTKAGLKFFECHISTPLEICEKRDVKGFYAKARAGVIKNFTGVSDSYESPNSPDIRVDTSDQTIEQSTALIQQALGSFGIIKDVRNPKKVTTLVKPMTIEEREEIDDDDMGIIKIDLDQAEMIRIISQGWAYPLQNFMNEE